VLQSGALSESRHVLVVLFISKFFDLGAIFFKNPTLFSFSEKDLLIHRKFPPENWHFPPWQEGFSFLG
jgi:hypothetical protein